MQLDPNLASLQPPISPLRLFSLGVEVLDQPIAQKEGWEHHVWS